MKQKVMAGLLAALLAVGTLGCGQKENITQPEQPGVLAKAAHPQMVQFPSYDEYEDDKAYETDYRAWQKTAEAQRRPEGYADSLQPFFAASIPEFLSGHPGENVVYSPLNVYMALAMLAETTGGETRDEILTLLGQDRVEDLRAQASDLWNDNYCDDGAFTSILGSSLWLGESLRYNRKTVDTLAKDYYASVFQGTMGSADYDRQLQTWLDEQTGGLLTEQAQNQRFEPDTVMALATTIYYQARWAAPFSEGATETGIFHSPNGDVECDMMHQTDTMAYGWGEGFSAVERPMERGGSMWLILPDEGVTPEELLRNPQAVQFLLEQEQWENQQQLWVEQTIPRFDVTSVQDLKGGLQKLGVTKVFELGTADFSPMLEEDAYVSKVQHDARVKIDEEGCEAAAYTLMAMEGASEPPEEKVQFVLDRPFLFAITGESGLPLFVGVVNHPA